MSVPPLDLPASAEELGRLLAQAKSRYTAAEAAGLARGAAAAPPAENPDAWIRLVAPEPSRELTEALRRLRDFAVAALREGREVPVAERLARLRAELERRGLAGFVVPRADEHQGEYVPLRSERLAWISGFTGSAGLVIVVRDRAVIFVDGRYTVQVRAETDPKLFEYRHLIEEPPADWIAGTLKPGDRLGYDPWLHTPEGVRVLARAAEKAGASLVACADSPLDQVWGEQPPPPVAPVVPHPERFAGLASAQKRREVGDAIAKAGADAAVLTQPDAIAWLLNVRGADVPHTPLPLSFAILEADGRGKLFIDPRKLAPETRAHLGNEVAVESPDAFGPALDALGKAGARVLADPATAAAWIFDRLGAAQARIVSADDPSLLVKACKNQVEIAGARAAHRRDGASLTRFLAWIAKEGPKGGLDELAAAERLYQFRRGNDLFQDLSFGSISAAGPNGALPHYRSDPRTNRKLEPGTLYLIDSGAQYLDGTTDVTRTVAVGAPTAEMRDRFTRVLKGHIALALLTFPTGTTGQQIDAIARLPLWRAGLDYDHGTGHGVGSYLSVHEGPQRISKAPNRIALRPGMIVSNEPGYYKPGAYGIRIENLVVVTKAAQPKDAEREMLGFETLTLAPIDRTLIEIAMLTAEERDWLNAYHARVREELTPLVDADTALWLAEATQKV
ncbi:MAG TPA: aminopeptidase P family protein [Alphaproteobacteria bacterium]|nr:aminopeptidase P family protein [Alphaproteobacteria bacterium]